jgi:hypothetical protein
LTMALYALALNNITSPKHIQKIITASKL